MRPLSSSITPCVTAVTALCLALLVSPTDAHAQSPRSLWSQAITPGVRDADELLHRAERLLFAANLYEYDPDPLHSRALRIAPELRLLNGDLGIARRRAIAMLQSALTTRPAHLDTLVALSSAYESDGRNSLADTTAARALSLSPPAPVAAALYARRATALSQLDRPGEAREQYLRALELPLSPSLRAVLLANLADTLAQLGELTASITAFQHSLALDPDLSLTRLGLAVTLDRHNDPYTREADRAALSASHLARAVRASGAHPLCPDDRAALACELDRPGVFFVPSYELYAQRALAHEAIARAIDNGPDPDRSASARHRAQALSDWQTLATLSPPETLAHNQATRHLRALTPLSH